MNHLIKSSPDLQKINYLKVVEERNLAENKIEELKSSLSELSDLKQNIKLLESKISDNQNSAKSKENELIANLCAGLEKRCISAEANTEKLTKEIAELNKARIDDHVIMAHSQTEYMRHKINSDNKDQQIKELKVMLAEKPVPVQSPIPPVQPVKTEPVKQKEVYRPEIFTPVSDKPKINLSPVGWNIEPKRDGSDKVLQYIVKSDSSSIPGWNIEPKRDGANKVLQYVITSDSGATGWTIDPRRDSTDKVLKYVLTPIK